MPQLAFAIPKAKQYEEWSNATGTRWLDRHEAVDREIAPFGLRAMEHADIRPGERVVDIGCGGGCDETTFALGRRVGASRFVTGLDVSRLLIVTARRLAERSSLSNIRCEARDAQAFPLLPQRSDLVFSRLGIMFFDDPEAVFSKLQKALRLGCRLSFVCWPAPQEN